MSEIMPDKRFTKVVDGQLVVATTAESGTIIPEEAKDPKKYYTALVQTESGQQLCVKTVNMGGGGGGGAAWGAITGTLSDQTDLKNALDDKQATLVSGTNIKTVNNNSLLGSGNISIDSLPSQTGNNGKFLTTDGSSASWATVDALPSQTGQSGKFLTTDGTDASWGSVPAPEGTYTQDNLIAGNGISITQVQQPLIDENTLAVWHFDDSFANAVSGGTVGDFYLDGSSSSSFSSAISKFGGFSLHCNNSGNDRSIVYPNSISFGENNFTVDFWIYLTDALYSTPFWLNFKGLGDVRIYQNKFQFLVSGVVQAESGNYDVNSWLHFAVERSSSTLNFYLNGTKFGTATSANSLTDITLQQQTGTYVYLDEFRLSNVARYNGQNFTPFNEPYSSASAPAQYQINNTQSAPSVMTGATSGAAGTSGLVPAPAAGDQAKYLTGAGTWAQPSGLQNEATVDTSLNVLGSTTNPNYLSRANVVVLGKGAYAQGTRETIIGHGAHSGYYTNNTGNVVIGYNAQSTSTGDVVIGDTAKASSDSVSIGKSSEASSSSVAVGNTAVCKSDNAVVLGYNANNDSYSGNSIVIGKGATASSAFNGIAIGTSASSSASGAIQIGAGTNSTADSLQIDTYQVFNRSTGKLIADRLGTGYDASKTQVLKNVQGVLTWVDE